MSKNISSTQKGDLLEKKAFELIKDLLNNDEFYVNGKKSMVFSKKSYYSERRKRNIIFDITIETYLKDADKYSLLTIIECKNVGRKVTVDDIEEFESKIRQVGEHNTKGLLITSSDFQPAAFQSAVSLGIGLIRITSNDQYQWINYRKEKVIGGVDQLNLTSQLVESKVPVEKFIAYANGRAINNFADLLLELNVIDYYKHNEKFINLPFISAKEMDEIIARLSKYDVYDGVLLDTEKLYKFLSSVYQVDFIFDNNLPDKILGKIEFHPLKIYVSKFLRENLHRWRFTLAHEVGHLILHSKLLIGKIDEKIDTDFSLSFNYHISDETSKRLEFQANMFASHLLLPIETFSQYVIRYFTQQNINKGFLYLDHQPVNKALVFTFLDKISKDYQVSLEVAKIRLKELDLLKDTTENTSLKSIMRNMKFK